MTFSKLMLMTASAASGLSISAAAAAHTDTPAGHTDQEWVTITGDISNVSPDGFNIDYGEGSIAVEMDGFLDASTAQFRDGD